MSRNHSWLRKLTTLIAAFAVLFSSTIVHAGLFNRQLAQADIKAPEIAPPVAEPPKAVVPGAAEEGQQLVIKVAAVAGLVQVRAAADQPWQLAKAGMDLSIGSEIRTGLRSVCKFTIDGNHEITLDRLGVVMVLDAIKSDGKIKTDVGMKYGRTQYKVETGAAEHDSKVHAPSATLAVRGSFVTLEDNDAFGSRAIVDHSENAIYKQRGPDGSVRVVSIELIKGRIEQGKEDAGKNPPTPAELALRDTINDVGLRLARASDLERDLVAMYPVFNGADSNGGGSIQDIQAQQPDTIIFPTFLSGGLLIEASWNGSQELALFATEPSSTGGKIITFPAPNFVASGFTSAVRPSGPAAGFASGSTNFASISYNEGVPGGTWGLGILLTDTGTAESIPFTINVFRTPVSEGSPQLIRSVSSVMVGSGSPNEPKRFGISTGFNVGFNVGAPPPPGSNN